MIWPTLSTYWQKYLLYSENDIDDDIEKIIEKDIIMLNFFVCGSVSSHDGMTRCLMEPPIGRMMGPLISSL